MSVTRVRPPSGWQTMTPEDYRQLDDDQSRLLEDWIEEHTGIPFQKERYIVTVSLIGEGRISIERTDDPPQVDVARGEWVILHATEYPSHRPPPVWVPV